MADFTLLILGGTFEFARQQSSYEELSYDSVLICLILSVKFNMFIELFTL